MKITTLLGVLTLSAAFSCSPAFAQTSNNCGPREGVVEWLFDRHSETRQSLGIAANGNLVETFASSETGSWTIVVTKTDGIACLLASGQVFENVSGLPFEKGGSEL